MLHGNRPPSDVVFPLAVYRYRPRPALQLKKALRPCLDERSHLINRRRFTIHYPGRPSSLEAQSVFSHRLIGTGLLIKIRSRKGTEAGYVDEANRQVWGNRRVPNCRWRDNLDRRTGEPGGGRHARSRGSIPFVAWRMRTCRGRVVLKGRRRRRRRGTSFEASELVKPRHPPQTPNPRRGTGGVMEWPNGKSSPSGHGHGQRRSDADDLVCFHPSSWRGWTSGADLMYPVAGIIGTLASGAFSPLRKRDWLVNPTFIH